MLSSTSRQDYKANKPLLAVIKSKVSEDVDHINKTVTVLNAKDEVGFVELQGTWLTVYLSKMRGIDDEVDVSHHIREVVYDLHRRWVGHLGAAARYGHTSEHGARTLPTHSPI